ncbi:MAG: choice-of-anchor Q domain-containing protein [Desulfobacterales bacterium]|jgi:hypothetical protein
MLRLFDRKFTYFCFGYMIFVGVLCICVLLAAKPSSAASLSFYYVSTGGSDNNPGTKISPWRTIQHAANVAPDGSIINVNSGIYEERVSITRSGTAEKKIFFKSIPRRSVNMRGFDIKADHIRVEGFNIDPGIGEGFGVFIHSGNYIDVIDNYMVNCKIGIFTRSRNIPGHLYISNNKMYRCNMGIMLFAHDSLIENNEVQRLVRSHGVDADYARFFGNNNVWRGNLFHGTSRHEIGKSHTDCFQFYDENRVHTHNTIIEKNICLGDFSQGMMLESDAYPDETYLSDLIVRNNIFAHGRAWAICGGKSVGWPNTIVVNNLFAYIRTMGVGIKGYKAKGGVVKNNIFYNCGNQPTPYFSSHGAEIEGGHNIIFNSGKSPGFNDLVGVDPMFVDAENNDFRLKPGSPAIDAGVSIAEVTTDIEGKPRPAGSGYDIGPYEY